MTAVCGEIPAYEIERLPGRDSYKRAVMTRLKKSGLVYTYTRNHLKGHRLTGKGKDYLRQTEPGKYDFFISGFGAHDSLKSEIGKRIRLHRVAQVVISMLKANVLVYRDVRKVNLFDPIFTEPEQFYIPAFYTSREIKAYGDDMIKIQSSRLIGVLLTARGVYMTYNFAEAAPKFNPQAEIRARAEIEYIIYYKRLSGVYGQESMYGLMFGDSLETMYTLWTRADKKMQKFLYWDSHYDHFYALTNDRRGELLLSILSDSHVWDTLNTALFNTYSLKPLLEDSYDSYDAITEQGDPVLFGCIPDLTEMDRFIYLTNQRETRGVIICFDDQKETLRHLFGNGFSIWTIEFKDAIQKLLPGLTVPE